MIRQAKIQGTKLTFEDDFETIFEKTVTKFGSGAKIDCPKEHLGKKVYVLIRTQ